jgi:outer membrane protein assembly factor BamB
MRTATGIHLLTLASALFACSNSPSSPKPSVPLSAQSPWPKFRANAAQDGRVAVRPTSSGGRFWSFRTGKGIFSSPVVGADGTVYIGSADRIFYAVRKDGTERWRVQTEEIIDSSALLDDKGRVYFGSGDGKLRALDAATGAPIWTFLAEDPASTNAFIRWFEGNVSIAPDGTLLVPNDNFRVYGVDRDTGMAKWSFATTDQTWSAPAVDAQTGALYFGNNNVIGLRGPNVFSLNARGEQRWGATTLGSVAASPLLTPDGVVVVGSFDGFIYGYDAATGSVRWKHGTREHVYASAARLSDGTVVVPSADGTVYALDASTGALRWAFDTPEPIRSSPAVDGDDNIYFGAGDGRLYVLRKDGTLRWSMRLIDGDRNDLNASPALGTDAIYIAGESGEVFSVPYDFCLRAANAADTRCETGGERLPRDGATLLFSSSLGASSPTPPAELDGNQPLVFSLVVREAGDTRLAIFDASALRVTLDPASPIDVTASGDGKFAVVTPRGSLPPGTLRVTIEAPYLVGLSREGLSLSGGSVGGTARADFTTTVRAAGTGPAIAIPSATGGPSATWSLSRLALPLPTILPSYNQIGFDSLHYLIGALDERLAIMVGAKLDAQGAIVIDPTSKAVLPLELDRDGALLTLRNEAGLKVEVMSAVIPLSTFRLSGRLDAQANMASPAHVVGSTICAQVPFYGLLLRSLGLCNPQTDVLGVYGGVLFERWGSGSVTAPAGVGTVTWRRTASAITATLTGSSLRGPEHLASIVLVDPSSGRPLSLDYGLKTTRTESAGVLASVTLSTAGATLPNRVRAYLVLDTYPAARADLEP